MKRFTIIILLVLFVMATRPAKASGGFDIGGGEAAGIIFLILVPPVAGSAIGHGITNCQQGFSCLSSGIGSTVGIAGGIGAAYATESVAAYILSSGTIAMITSYYFSKARCDSPKSQSQMKYDLQIDQLPVAGPKPSRETYIKARARVNF